MNGGQLREIDVGDQYRDAGALRDAVRHALPGGEVPDGEGDLGSLCGQGAGSLHADAGAAAGHDGPLAVKVKSVSDLRRGA